MKGLALTERRHDFFGEELDMLENFLYRHAGQGQLHGEGIKRNLGVMSLK